MAKECSAFTFAKSTMAQNERKMSLWAWLPQPLPAILPDDIRLAAWMAVVPARSE